MATFDFDFATQSQMRKLQLLSAYHAAEFTRLNREQAGYTDEKSFHADASFTLQAMANLYHSTFGAGQAK